MFLSFLTIYNLTFCVILNYCIYFWFRYFQGMLSCVMKNQKTSCVSICSNNNAGEGGEWVESWENSNSREACITRPSILTTLPECITIATRISFFIINETIYYTLNCLINVRNQYTRNTCMHAKALASKYQRCNYIFGT